MKNISINHGSNSLEGKQLYRMYSSYSALDFNFKFKHFQNDFSKVSIIRSLK